MKVIIDIPEGLKKDFELEQWTALSCVEMKEALENGTILPKHHGRLIDSDELIKHLEATADIEWNKQVGSSKGLEDAIDIVDDIPTIIEADKESD